MENHKSSKKNMRCLKELLYLLLFFVNINPGYGLKNLNIRKYNKKLLFFSEYQLLFTILNKEYR
ncbi:Uncharacterized protein dnm_013580 [Desulfonema magnum]|uniref:Uncharacterized protein n=1 Tax=Desulfonema magnum TaxID=45655 RepID=A0A975BHE0_9BACT|nr:Uncharacterized protein dnm_013580 [Desulfonema magnum]